MNPETERLRAEPISSAHQDDMVRLLSDPRVAATLGGVPSPARIAAMIERQGAQFERHGYGFWVWREKATGEVVARGGLQHTHVGGGDEVEVGWAVVADRWGEGLATELGAASVRAAFDDHGLADLVSFTLPTNLASRRVMEKLGFAYERDVVYAELRHVLYRLRNTGQAARPGTAIPAS
jgi:ribosomal-protein-alanine N-acetyltransferase